uniref:Ig-like domain-containing protein n=1 Tax=Haplochromis burtoni TaxID=8153 RepID=A0A3Q3C636_HAPBU
MHRRLGVGILPKVTWHADWRSHTGQDITLPCKYDRKYYGALSVCWQRGEIPTRGCSNQLISTDGLRVETRASSRYQLLGQLEDGDVSLTIKSLTERDAGRYGCRVEIPGWFNDDKHHIDVCVVTGEDPVRFLEQNALKLFNLKNGCCASERNKQRAPPPHRTAHMEKIYINLIKFVSVLCETCMKSI